MNTYLQGPLVHICIDSFPKYRVHNLVTDKRTNERKDGRTDRRTENINPPAR